MICDHILSHAHHDKKKTKEEKKDKQYDCESPCKTHVSHGKERNSMSHTLTVLLLL